MDSINLTPSWGAWGNVYRHFAEAGAKRAVRDLRADFQRAMAGAQALQALTASGTLTDAQEKIIAETLTAELARQGVR